MPEVVVARRTPARGAESTHLLMQIGQALLMAAGMFWQVGWSLVLGFAISAMLQAIVSKERMGAALGRNGVREIALATAAGAASSSCSYASAAVSRTLFKKGAALIPSLAFIFASTNLVVGAGHRALPADGLAVHGRRMDRRHRARRHPEPAGAADLSGAPGRSRLAAIPNRQAAIEHGDMAERRRLPSGRNWRAGETWTRSRRASRWTGPCCGRTCCWAS